MCWSVQCVYRQTVPLLNLRLPSEEHQSWQKVSEKSKRHPSPNNGHTASGMFFLNTHNITSSLCHVLTWWCFAVEWENRGGWRSGKAAPYSANGGRVNKQHSWPPQSTTDEQTAGRGKIRCAVILLYIYKNCSLSLISVCYDLCVCRRSDQRSSPVCVLQQKEEESALLELLHKDEHNFPSLGTSLQTVTSPHTHHAHGWHVV